MLRSPTPIAALPRLATAILAASAAGWLASGSCVVAGCYEDCDPCFQACKCRTVCQHPVVGEHGLVIVEHTSRVLADEARFVRLIDVVIGPSLEFAPAVRNEGATGIADFARGVLDVNAELFTAERDPAWTLAAVETFPAHTTVQFAHDPGPYGSRSANSVTFLFDGVGRLLEVTQVVERRP
jgi:hypothetical protein